MSLRYKVEKVNTTIKFSVQTLVKIPNFSLNRQFWFFGLNFFRKVIIGPTQKSKHHCHIRIQLIQRLLRTNFQHKHKILNFFAFWSNLIKNCITGLKQKSERHHQIKKFELVEAASFPLNERLWIFCTKFAPKGSLCIPKLSFSTARAKICSFSERALTKKIPDCRVFPWFVHKISIRDLTAMVSVPDINL